MIARVLALFGLALPAVACNGDAGPATTGATTATTTTQATTTTTVVLEPATPEQQLSTGTALSAPGEVNLENNITVFFKSEAVTDVREAESALLEVVGDRDIVSLHFLSRQDARAEAQRIVELFGARLTPSEIESVAEVARILVVHRDVRNELTDDLEDSNLLAGVGYVVGMRPAGDGSAFDPTLAWEALAYYWAP